MHLETLHEAKPNQLFYWGFTAIDGVRGRYAQSGVFFFSDFVCEKKGLRNYSRLLRLASANLKKSNSKFGSLIDV